MKKIRITITREFELPDECAIVVGPEGKLIKYGNLYFNPEIEFMQSNQLSEKKMRFEELDEESADILYGAMVSDNDDISEV